jgi:hypothetical protein
MDTTRPLYFPRLNLRIAFVPLLLSGFVIFGVAALFTAYAADDYCQALAAREHGIFGSTVNAYMTWSGRYSQNIASGTAYTLFGQAAPLLMAFGSLATLVLILNSLYGSAGVLLALAFLLALGENIWQGLFWMPANITYVVPILFLLILMRGKENPYLLAALIPGFNESVGVLLAFGALLHRKWLLAVIALVATAIAFLAPGNAVRAAFFEQRAVTDSIAVGIVIISRFLTGLLIHAPIALLAALVAGMMLPKVRDGRLVTILLAAIALGIIPTLHLSGAVTPRVLVLPTAAIVGLCFHLGQVMGQRTTLAPQLKYATALLVIVGAMNFGSAAFASTKSFAERAGLEPNNTLWISQCIERL